MLIHCDASVRLPHQQCYSEWNGLARSPDAKLQPCTTIVWWSQFDCDKHFAEQQNTYRSVELLSKHSLTSDLLPSVWLDKMKLGEWEESFKEMLKRRETSGVCCWSACARQHWGEFAPIHLSPMSLCVMFYGQTASSKAFLLCKVKDLLYIWLACTMHRVAVLACDHFCFQIVRDFGCRPGFMFFCLADSMTHVARVPSPYKDIWLWRATLNLIQNILSVYLGTNRDEDRDKNEQKLNLEKKSMFSVGVN